MTGSKQRQTLFDLSSPQQMRELNRQLEWLWAQVLGGLPIKALNEEAQGVISSKVAKGEVISSINQSAEEVAISAQRINLNGAVSANTFFKINLNGSMEARSGKIGGFTIGENSLSSGGAHPVVLDAAGETMQVGTMFIYTNENGYAEINNGESELLLSARQVALNVESLQLFTVSAEGVFSQGVRVPKIVRGSAYVNGALATRIDYSGGYFTEIPQVIAGYATAGANESGDDGLPKVYAKTVNGANVILSGSGARQIDWIAVGI